MAAFPGARFGIRELDGFAFAGPFVRVPDHAHGAALSAALAAGAEPLGALRGWRHDLPK